MLRPPQILSTTIFKGGKQTSRNGLTQWLVAMVEFAVTPPK